MKNQKKTEASSNDEIRPMEDPSGAIDFYMPLPDDVYKKWKKK